jgi:hypothetical protein
LEVVDVLEHCVRFCGLIGGGGIVVKKRRNEKEREERGTGSS